MKRLIATLLCLLLVAPAFGAQGPSQVEGAKRKEDKESGVLREPDRRPVYWEKDKDGKIKKQEYDGPKFTKAKDDSLVWDFVVAFKDLVVKDADIQRVSEELVARYGGTLEKVNLRYREFRVKDLPEKAAERLSGDDRLLYIMRYPKMERATSQPRPTSNVAPASEPPVEVREPGPDPLAVTLPIQFNSQWGLDRIDQQRRPRNNLYQFTRISQASPVRVYYIGNGVDGRHPEFSTESGLHEHYKMFAGGDAYPEARDVDGWGTAVYSVLAGKTAGVAPGVKFTSYRVDGWTDPPVPTLSTMQAIEDSLEAIELPTNPKILVWGYAFPPIISDGQGGSYNVLTRIHTRIEGCISSLPYGTVFLCSSGGQNGIGAGPSSPQGQCVITRAVCLGASDEIPAGVNGVDQITPFSPRGGSVDLFAPGDDLRIATRDPDPDNVNFSYTSTGKGTLLSIAMTAGVAAQYWSANLGVREVSVRKGIIDNTYENNGLTTTNHPANTTRRMLYSRFNKPAVRHAASYGTKLAPDSIATAFTDRQFSMDSIIFNFGGATEYPSPFTFYFSPGQTNFLVPSGILTGLVPTQFNGEWGCSAGDCGGPGVLDLDIARVAPGLFTPSGSGSGLVSGWLLKVNQATGAQTYELLSASGNSVGAAGYDYYLVLWGTGWRNRLNPETTANVSATLGMTPLIVTYAGAVGDANLFGLDQFNLKLSPGFADYNLKNLVWSVEGVAGNTVQVNLQP